METTGFSHCDLKELRRQLNAWRRRRTGRQIPAEVWAAATALARVHGAGQVGRTLHLDYYKLRERVGSPPNAAPRTAFVEVGWPSAPAVAVAGGGCTVELTDGSARRMRMQLAGDAATLVALAQAFWKSPA